MEDQLRKEEERLMRSMSGAGRKASGAMTRKVEVKPAVVEEKKPSPVAEKPKGEPEWKRRERERREAFERKQQEEAERRATNASHHHHNPDTAEAGACDVPHRKPVHGVTDEFEERERVRREEWKRLHNPWAWAMEDPDNRMGELEELLKKKEAIEREHGGQLPPADKLDTAVASTKPVATAAATADKKVVADARAESAQDMTDIMGELDRLTGLDPELLVAYDELRRAVRRAIDEVGKGSENSVAAQTVAALAHKLKDYLALPAYVALEKTSEASEVQVVLKSALVSAISFRDGKSDRSSLHSALRDLDSSVAHLDPRI